MPRRGSLLIAAIVLATSALAAAAPRDVRLRLHDAAACGETCGAESALAEGARFAGTLRLEVHAEDPVGMRRIRVEARPEGASRSYCIAEADTRDDGQSVDVTFTWETRSWPSPESGSGCTHTLPHIHGSPTANGRYELRAVAVNLVDDQQTGASAPVTIRLTNPPVGVSWREDPVVSPSSRATSLAWVPGTEPDLVAYRIDREGPDGKRSRMIDAREPARSGCTRIGESEIRCGDPLPAAGGSYTYRITALRPGGAARCGPRADCVAGPASDARSVTVAAAPSASGSGAPGPAPRPSDSVRPTAEGSATPGPGEIIPSDEGEPIAAGSDGSGSVFPVFLLVLAGLAAASVLWVRQRRGRAR